MSVDKMTASQQQKLKMKMISIDSWSKREQLCLASSVLRSGDQNWVSVSRSLKPFAEPNRPDDWLSPRNCALQYNTLLEKAGAHKRKRGERHPSSGSTTAQQGETPGEIILKQLTQERIEELQQILESSRNEYNKLKKELDMVLEGKLNDKLGEFCKKIDEENGRKEQEQAMHVKWLEERERKMAERDQAFKNIRSPSKESQRFNNLVEMTDQSSDVGSVNSPSVTEQLNIDVLTEEIVESNVETKTTPVASQTPTTSATLPPPATPSSPLLTSLLRSPTNTSPAGTKGLSPSVSTKLNFPLASPSGLSSGLKNLLSTVIGDESPSKTAATPTPQAATNAGVAPTLTRLLELPLNAPGKPLPELAPTEENAAVDATSVTTTSVVASSTTTVATMTSTTTVTMVTTTTATAPAAPVPVAEHVKPPEPVAIEEVKAEDKDVVTATVEEVSMTTLEPEESLATKMEDEPAAAEEVQSIPSVVEETIVEEVPEVEEHVVAKEVEISDSVARIEEVVQEVESETIIEETHPAIDHHEETVSEVVVEEAPETPEIHVKTEPTDVAEVETVTCTAEVEVSEVTETVVETEPVKTEEIHEEIETTVESEVEVRQEHESIPAVVPTIVEKVEEVVQEQSPEPVQEASPISKLSEAEKPAEVESEEKVQEKSTVKAAEAESTPSKPAEIETPTLTRRPLRSAPRSRKGATAESETPTEDKEKLKTESGPSTRRSTGRRAQVEEGEGAEAAPEEATEATPPAASVTIKKRPAPLAPLQAPLSSPAPSSGIDSTPNSPTSSVSTVTEDDRDHRTWKKSILLVWRELSSHKNASLFQKPITEEHVPGYRSLIFRPIDLSTIKKNIESGSTRSTTEFHRDVTLMFLNSIFYNPSDHEVHRLAKEMLAESNTIIQEYVNAQLLAQSNEPVRPARRETRDSSRRTESVSSSHDEASASKPEEGKTRASKRASLAVVATDDTKKRRSRTHFD